MAHRRFSTRLAGLIICVSALGITSCSDRNDVPATTTKAKAEAPAMTKPEKTLLAEWHSFSYNPPLYAVENVLVYSDFSCAVTATADNSNSPCTWKRAPNDRMVLHFPANNSQVATSLRPPLSTEGRKQAGTAGYLIIDFDDGRRQTFVLAGSEDDKMVRDTINGERNWNAGRYDAGIKDLRRAYAHGSNYARLRLAWIYATTKEFHLPMVALKMLAPLRVNTNNYGVMDTLAAAYAANGQYDDAVKTAETACRLAPAAQQGGCQQRLAQFKARQPLVISLSQPWERFQPAAWEGAWPKVVSASEFTLPELKTADAVLTHFMAESARYAAQAPGETR